LPFLGRPYYYKIITNYVSSRVDLPSAANSNVSCSFYELLGLIYQPTQLEPMPHLGVIVTPHTRERDELVSKLSCPHFKPFATRNSWRLFEVDIIQGLVYCKSYLKTV
jgi:hypothetical protein